MQTVYYVFGTKRNLLAAVLDATVSGDDENIPVVEQAWVDGVVNEEVFLLLTADCGWETQRFRHWVTSVL